MGMTEQMAIRELEDCIELPFGVSISDETCKMAIKALEEIQQYRAIGTVEELQNAVKEEDVLKFYYCESEDSYLLGIRIDNFYYAHWDGKRFVFDMSRYLPWGEHIVASDTLWKEHTYPSEPKEIDFSSWLQGFIKKECGGTIAELQALKEKSVAKKPILSPNRLVWHCPNPFCPEHTSRLSCEKHKICHDCGQYLDWE